MTPLTLDSEIIATGSREGAQGELALKSGGEKTIDLPLRVFTRQAIGHALAGLVKKGSKLTLKGTLKFNTMMGIVTIPYSVERII
ncbi:MAG: hypothetical protein HZB29_05870 [Nitrospinae bacterium]|nr:hypothetical protein [Nitrospinota bacterium]